LPAARRNCIGLSTGLAAYGICAYKFTCCHISFFPTEILRYAQNDRIKGRNDTVTL
jgi:hypothetical protein